MHSYNKNIKCRLNNVLILSILTAAAAITILIFTASSSNTGVVGQTSILISACPSTYFADKYSNIRLINTLIFASSCVTALIAIHIALTIIIWHCKSSDNQKFIPKAQLFFFSSCQVLTSLPQFGYLLSFYVELGNCSAINNYSIITIIVAAALLFLALVQNISIMCIDSQGEEEVQKKYRFIYSQQTEHGEEAKPIKHNRKQAPLIIKTSIVPQYQQHTKEAINLYNETVQERSPTKPASRFETKVHQTNKFEDEQHRYSIKHQSPSLPNKERPPIYMQQRITINLHPNLKQVDPSQYVQNQKRNNYQIDIIHNQFQEEQQKYLQSAYTNILPRGGVQQRERQPKNHAQTFKREEPFPKRPTGYQDKGAYKSSHNNYFQEYPSEQKYYSPNRRSNKNKDNYLNENNYGHNRDEYYNNRNVQDNSFRIYDQPPRRNKKFYP